MSLLRTAIARGAPQLSKIGRVIPAKQIVARNFSSILESREQGEEAKYIRSQEAQQKAARLKEIERILALENGSQEKDDLVELLDRKDEPKGFLSKWGLDDWKFALPIGIFAGIPLITNEILVLDAETQLVGCFILFCSTMYTQLGSAATKEFGNYSKEIADSLRSADEASLSEIYKAIEHSRSALTVEEEFKEYTALADNLAVAQAQALNNREEHVYREAIIKKLDSLAALEENAVLAIRNRMLTKVKADVVDTFTNDKKIKEASLNRAIDYLAGGAKGNLGKDIVGEVFQQALVNYREGYSKQAPGSDPIIKQLEKDMAAVATAPVIEGKGGNVFAL